MANFILFDSISCSKARSEFSAYLDGAVSGRDMQSIASHLKSCADCTAEFAAWQSTQRAISSLGALKAPEDLGLRLRLAISREKAKQASHWTDRFSLRWHNVLGPLALQASAGLAAAVLLVGGMITMLGVAHPAPSSPMTSLSTPSPHRIIATPRRLHPHPGLAGRRHHRRRGDQRQRRRLRLSDPHRPRR